MPVKVALAGACATYGRLLEGTVHAGFGQVESDDLVEPSEVASSAERRRPGPHTLVGALLAWSRSSWKAGPARPHKRAATSRTSRDKPSKIASLPPRQARGTADIGDVPTGLGRRKLAREGSPQVPTTR